MRRIETAKSSPDGNSSSSFSSFSSFAYPCQFPNTVKLVFFAHNGFINLFQCRAIATRDLCPAPVCWRANASLRSSERVHRKRPCFVIVREPAEVNERENGKGNGQKKPKRVARLGESIENSISNASGGFVCSSRTCSATGRNTLIEPS